MNKSIAIQALLLVLFLSGCSSVKSFGDKVSNIEPWVKPYERANLADESMRVSRDPVSDAYINHVHEAREGARGAVGSGGGGCGCN